MADHELLTTGRALYWPRLLFPADLALVFRVSEETAARWLRKGRLGPVIRVGRRLAVLKESLVQHLEASQYRPEGQSVVTLAPSERPHG